MIMNNSMLKRLRMLYGDLQARAGLLQCMYLVTIEDVLGIGAGIPWFEDKKLWYLVTDTNLSFGTSASETVKVGSLPFSYLSENEDDDMSITFVETKNAEIFTSFRACKALAINKDATVNEPAKYTFKLTIGVVDHSNPTAPPKLTRSWLVSAKSGETDLSATSRSELVKSNITFQKIAPLIFAS